MKFNHKGVVMAVALSLFAILSACVPVLAQTSVYGGDNAGYLQTPKNGMKINEALRAGILGGDQVGNQGPAPGDNFCNMSPQDASSCYANMLCGPSGQQCVLNHHHHGQCTM